ncbi:hypothetical protein KWG70_12550 [Psychroserpens sp. XSD401]|nr:hypothetical protein [Psychroserpens luteolus]
MNNEKVLRVLSIVTFAYALIRVLYYLQKIVYTYLDGTSSPLIPTYLWKFAAFPKIILSLIFIVIAIYSYRSFKTKRYHTFVIWLLFVYSVLFIFIGHYIYDFINTFNPYGS